jgi:hypothetical protein
MMERWNVGILYKNFDRVIRRHEMGRKSILPRVLESPFLRVLFSASPMFQFSIIPLFQYSS